MITVGSRTFLTVDQLEELVVHAATHYDLFGYAEDFDGVEVTDPEYDVLLRKLRIDNPSAEALKGTTPSKAVAKGSTIKHDPPMTSIEKADGNPDDKIKIYKAWNADVAKRLGLQVSDLVTTNMIAQSYKRDGVALRINYVKGKLVSAGLRPRNGIDGSDVTRHMKYIQGVPIKLAYPLTLSLNGEIECWNEDFVLVNADMDAAGEEPYKNPRNYTAGCMGRDDAEENKNARLRIAYYSITGFDDWQKYYKTEIERAKWVNSKDGLNLQDEDGNGYFIQVRPHLFPSLQVMEEYTSKLPYYTDGIVLKVNDLEKQEELGHSGDDPINAPRGALAWKFEEETAEAEVSSIEWNASRTGRIVPTAIFDIPFELADTSNSRATANNVGWMMAQKLGPGAKVVCKKGGKIIPNIVKVIEGVDDLGIPKCCPTCGGIAMINVSLSGNQDLMCHNKSCGAKQVKSWIFYVTKLGGKGLGLSTMEKLLNTGKVKSLANLYDLTVEDLKSVGLSDRQAALALATIYLVKPESDNDKLLKKIAVAAGKKHIVEGWKFFAALGIPGAGETAGKALMKHYGDFEKARWASVEDLRTVSGIGEITAKAIRNWFDDNDNNPMVTKLLQKFDLEMPKTGKLSGLNFCITGTLPVGRNELKKQIEDVGGNCQSSVGSSTNYLVVGTDAGKDKTDKAEKFDVALISYDDIQKML